MTTTTDLPNDPLGDGIAWLASVMAVHAELPPVMHLAYPVRSEPTYRIHQSERLAIQCLICGAVSYHIGDVIQRYCGRCHMFHEEG
jgi:hypothetical protein